ncbi:hypothetical protein EV702DRAFT_1043293 [Suillus placidus]|uniref:Uncharacterized protein n=1 Tax=Suillus placidus TaxID=48579 RepID=A0A9P6ZZX3_9AGAM|nr:hypothetical protein EV702DRAFT_1043293 [Suillus placidus]
MFECLLQRFTTSSPARPQASVTLPPRPAHGLSRRIDSLVEVDHSLAAHHASAQSTITALQDRFPEIVRGMSSTKLSTSRRHSVLTYARVNEVMINRNEQMRFRYNVPLRGPLRKCRNSTLTATHKETSLDMDCLVINGYNVLEGFSSYFVIVAVLGTKTFNGRIMMCESPFDFQCPK